MHLRPGGSSIVPPSSKNKGPSIGVEGPLRAVVLLSLVRQWDGVAWVSVEPRPGARLLRSCQRGCGAARRAGASQQIPRRYNPRRKLLSKGASGAPDVFAPNASARRSSLGNPHDARRGVLIAFTPIRTIPLCHMS